MDNNVKGEDEGSFDSDNIFEDLSDKGNHVKEILTSDPNKWTDEQITIVVVVSIVALALILMILWCYRYQPCRRKAVGSLVNPRHTLERPYVTRRGARMGNPNADDKLPQGCTLHGAEKLHAAGLDGRGVRVAVIDTGIDKQHPCLEGRVVRQEWYRLGTPLAIDDHGTHVAGTIHFMAPKANIYDYRVIGKTGDMDSDTAVAEAIRDAVQEGCQIINISIRISYPLVKDVKKAVQYAHREGIIMVCATGNYPGDADPNINHRLTYPAKWKETISVAAIKKGPGGTPVASFSDVLAGFGGLGFPADLAAVGADVVSLKPGGGYQVMSGPSVAAPHVTGMLAAMMTGGGDLKMLAKKLVLELKSTYSLEFTAKGSDNNGTDIDFPTFLTKWEFDKFWRRHSIGHANIHERPSIRKICNNYGSN
ncbi:unnamed protein product, partial [Cylindrotheca closterium]